MPILITTARPSALTRLPGATKVPEILAVFWILKLLTTAMGESASDYLLNADPLVCLPIGVVGFVVALWLQFRTWRYHPVAFWWAIAMVAVFGTMVADMLHVGLGASLLATTVICAVALTVTFVI